MEDDAKRRQMRHELQVLHAFEASTPRQSPRPPELPPFLSHLSSSELAPLLEALSGARDIASMEDKQAAISVVTERAGLFLSSDETHSLAQWIDDESQLDMPASDDLFATQRIAPEIVQMYDAYSDPDERCGVSFGACHACDDSPRQVYIPGLGVHELRVIRGTAEETS